MAELGRIARFGPFEANLTTGELRKHGIRLKLPNQSAEILAALLERPGELVTREELREKLWPTDTFVDFDHGLNNAIRRLREALCDSADAPQFIETLPRRGYRFTAPLESGSPAIPAAQPGPLGQPGQEGTTRPLAPRGARRRWIQAAGLVATAAVVLFLSLGPRHRHTLASRRPSELHSIAVLPLENLTGDPSQEYFADGMTDALITDLAQIGALQVISRTSTMHYKGTRKPLAQIARELNVNAVVEGAVMRSGDHVQIDAQLIRAATDEHLWAKSYEGSLRDIIVLQDQVAQAIATQVAAKLTPQEQAHLAGTQVVNPEAYESYVKGRLLWSQWSVEEARKALPYFQQAIKTDPNYAAAYAGLADSYRILALLGGQPSREAWRKAKAAALKALEIDPTLAQAHRSLGAVRLWYDWDPAGSEKEYLRALQLNPGDAETYRTYSVLLRSIGRSDQALAVAKRAQELDPLSPGVGTDLGGAYYFAGQYDQAVSQLQKVLELNPSFGFAHRWLGFAYLGQGKLPEAISEYKLAVEVSPENLLYQAALGRAYAMAGQRAQALAILKRLKELSKSRYVSPVQIGLVYGSLGDKSQEFAWLEKAYQQRDDFLLALPVAPWVDPGLRSDARFAHLMQRVQQATRH